MTSPFLTPLQRVAILGEEDRRQKAEALAKRLTAPPPPPDPVPFNPFHNQGTCQERMRAAIFQRDRDAVRPPVAPIEEKPQIIDEAYAATLSQRLLAANADAIAKVEARKQAALHAFGKKENK